MEKIFDIEKMSEIAKRFRRSGKTTGLIIGCFDVIHIGHIELFRAAKQRVDIVIVGLENDASIRLSKGYNRPINNFNDREQLLVELRSVDFVFLIETVILHTIGNSYVYDAIASSIKPDFIITDPRADRFWREKQKRAKMVGAKFLAIEIKKENSSTHILQKFLKEL